jgi:hypothetical protein
MTLKDAPSSLWTSDLKRTSDLKGLDLKGLGTSDVKRTSDLKGTSEHMLDDEQVNTDPRPYRP